VSEMASEENNPGECNPHRLGYFEVFERDNGSRTENRKELGMGRLNDTQIKAYFAIWLKIQD